MVPMDFISKVKDTSKKKKKTMRKMIVDIIKKNSVEHAEDKS